MEAGSAHKLAREPLASECFAQVARLSEDPVVRARAMIEQATILSYSGDWEQAESSSSRSSASFRTSIRRLLSRPRRCVPNFSLPLRGEAVPMTSLYACLRSMTW